MSVYFGAYQTSVDNLYLSNRPPRTLKESLLDRTKSGKQPTNSPDAVHPQESEKHSVVLDTLITWFVFREEKMSVDTLALGRTPPNNDHWGTHILEATSTYK